MHLFEAPETVETINAVNALDEAFEKVKLHFKKGERDIARVVIEKVIEATCKVAGATNSAAVLDRFKTLGYRSYRCGDLRTAQKAWSAATTAVR